MSLPARRGREDWEILTPAPGEIDVPMWPVPVEPERTPVEPDRVGEPA